MSFPGISNGPYLYQSQYGNIPYTKTPGAGAHAADVLGTGAVGALGGAATGAMIGSIIPGIGTLLGAGIGALVGGLFGGLGGQKKYEQNKSTALAAQKFEQSQVQVLQEAQGLINGGSPGIGGLNAGLL